MNVLLRFACMGILCLVARAACAQMNLGSDAVIYSTEASAETPADSTALFTIKDIIITGNRQTKPATILRELSFSTEEQYPLNEIVDKFAGARQQLMNTGLFRSVIVSLKSLRGYDVYVNIEVEER
ncbi:MAG TPA: POTRA domain-containing protein, partial [Flavisolibacter sp.]|nr:POTRA domain-containing protein [Flavisolibacter sp.]